MYLDTVTSISAFTSGRSLIQRFGEEQLNDGGGSGLGVDAKTHEVLVADAAASRIDVYVPAPPGPPAVEPDSVSAAHVTSGSAKLRAAIDPAGADTHYRFLYGTVECAGSPSPCAGEAPAKPGTDIGEGFGSQPAAAEVNGLSAGTTYHFVVVAENENGSVQSEQEGKFTTSASSEAEAALPDGRAWELVSPADKRGVAIEPIAHEGGLIQASASGGGLAFIADAPAGEEEPEGNRAPELSQLIATRHSAAAWSTRNLTTPNQSAQGIKADDRREYQYFSSDLSLAAVFPVEPLPPSSTTEPTPEGTLLAIYLRNTACPTHACSLPVAASPNPGLIFEGASPDLQHLVVKSPVPLVAGATGSGLYEWSASEEHAGEGHLRLVSILPNGEAATGAIGLGITGSVKYEGPRHAISDDGSRMVWKARDTGGAHLYMSELVQEEGKTKVHTTQIDTPNEGVESKPVKREPVLMTASVKGDRVFFTDNQRLTEDASPETEAAGDLYVFEGAKPAGQRVTDLSPDANAGERAAVQGGVIGAGDDGSSVYFVANGALAEGAKPGNCRAGGPSHGRPATSTSSTTTANSGKRPVSWRALVERRRTGLGAGLERQAEYRLTEIDLPGVAQRPLPGVHVEPKPDGLRQHRRQPSGERRRGGLPLRLDCRAARVRVVQPERSPPVRASTTARNPAKASGLLVDRLEIWSSENEDAPDHWLAGSVPGWTADGLATKPCTSRATSQTAAGCSSTAPTRSSRRTQRQGGRLSVRARRAQGSCASETPKAAASR